MGVRMRKGVLMWFNLNLGQGPCTSCRENFPFSGIGEEWGLERLI